MKSWVKRQVLLITCAIIALVITTIFLVGCAQYGMASANIRLVEFEATLNSHHTEDGYFNGWDENLITKYNDKMKEKTELQANNVVARWCYLQGATNIGKFMRLMCIVITFCIATYSLQTLVEILGEDIWYVIKKRKKK